MSTVVVNDCELGLIAVDYPVSQMGSSEPESGTSLSRRAGISSISAFFEFRTNFTYPHFRDRTDDLSPALMNIVTDRTGKIYAYAYSKTFIDPSNGTICPAGHYFVQLMTVGIPVADDEGVVTICYEVEPLRRDGRFVPLKINNDEVCLPYTGLEDSRAATQCCFS